MSADHIRIEDMHTQPKGRRQALEIHALSLDPMVCPQLANDCFRCPGQSFAQAYRAYIEHMHSNQHDNREDLMAPLTIY